MWQGTEGGPWLTVSQDTPSVLPCKGMNSANNLNELGNGTQALDEKAALADDGRAD